MKLVISMTYKLILPASWNLAINALGKAKKNPELLQAWADSLNFLLCFHLSKETNLK